MCKLTTEQLTQYEEQGFLLLPELFSGQEIDLVKSRLPDLYARDLPGKVMEEGQTSVRMIHGVHKEDVAFEYLASSLKIVEPVRQILASDIYIHQFKINAKTAFDGEMWQWHQDSIYLLEEDGIPTPRLANAIIFLDEVNEFNGPIFFIPGSHKEGIVSTASEAKQSHSYRDRPEWIAHMTTRLKYVVAPEVVRRLVAQTGMAAPKGPAGSVLFFHPSCVHGSAQNMSPFDRAIVVINFNSVENSPQANDRPRPEFLASRDCRPLQPQSSASLLELLELERDSLPESIATN